jgi:prephenate dehydrogenase
MMIMRKSMGMLGFGRFGEFAAGYLKNYFDVFVYDCEDIKEKASEMGITLASLEECAAKDIVLICVPISKFEEVLKEIVPFLKAGAIVADVCSVKEEIVDIMEKLVPKECECIGTHPLFGPDSAQDGLTDMKIVLCPIRINNLKNIEDFLKELGLTVVLADPEEHDKQMAKSLGLIHLLGKVLVKIGGDRVELATATYERLLDLVKIAQNDSTQLFYDMHRHNRFAKLQRQSLIEELKRIDEELESGS